MLSGKAIWELLKSTAAKWSDKNSPRLGASLAFYMLLSMAPLLILVVAICGLVFSEATAQQQVLAQVRSIAGATGEKTVSSLIQSAHKPSSGILATTVAFITLLTGASGVFMELRDSLNTIWDAPASTASGIAAIIWQRIVSFGMVLSLGLLLLVSLIASAAIALVENFFADLVPMHFAVVGRIADFTLSSIGILVLFGLIFKYVPNIRIAWRDVAIGAVFTAALFIVGRTLLGIYMLKVGVGSTYGAAGSLVALVVWVYYSAQIFFFGATFTRVYADRFGSLSKRNPSKSPEFPARLVTKSQGA